MLKKLALALLCSSTIACYADAPIMIPVTGNVSNQHFHITTQNWGYQFDNQTGKSFIFTITAASYNMLGTVQMQCWHKLAPVYTRNLRPNETASCLTDDSVRLVSTLPTTKLLSGTYNITVNAK